MAKRLLILLALVLKIVSLSAQLVDSNTVRTTMQRTSQQIKGIGTEFAEEGQKKFKTVIKDKLKLPKLPIDTAKLKKVEFHGRIFSEVSYVNNGLTPDEYNGVYGRYGFAPNLKILGMPFSAEFTLNTQNKQVRFDYSILNFQFDISKYKNELKDKYLKTLEDPKNYYPTDVGERVSKMQDTLTALDSYNKLLSNPNYYQDMSKLQSQMKPLQDSLSKNVKLDSAQQCTYDSIKEYLDMMRGYVKKLSAAQKYVNEHKDDLKKLEDYKSYVTTVKNSADITSIPGVKEQLGKAGILTKKLKFFAGVQKLQIGRVNVNYSKFTVANQSLYGFNFEYMVNNLLYIGVGAGVPAAFNFGFSTQFFTHPTNPFANMNRGMGFLRIGLGKATEDHLHLIYFVYGQNFNNSNNTYGVSIPPANSVLSLDFQRALSKSVKIQAEAAISNSSFLSRSASFAPVEVRDKKAYINYAVRMAIDGNIKKTGTTLGARFETVSDNFNTNGNAFLRKGNLEYGFNIKQSLLDKKISIAEIFTHSILSFDRSANRTQSVNNNFNVSYKPSTKMNFSAVYIFMKQMPTAISGNSSSFVLHTLNLMQQYNAQILKTRSVTQITSVFNVSKNQSTEFSSNTKSIQNSVLQTFIFKNGITFQPGAGIILANQPTEPKKLHAGYWVEGGNSFNIKSKVTFQYHVKYLIDKVIGNNLNVTCGFTAKIYKNLQFTSHGQYTLLKTAMSPIDTQNMNFTGGLSYSW